VSAPAVEFDRVSFTYPGADGPALESVSLTVSAGTRLGILGPNGGGKSTLLKLVLGLLKPTSGSVRVLGTEPLAARQSGLIGYVPQRVEAELSAPLSVRQVVMLAGSLGSPWYQPTPRAVRQRTDELLSLVGVTDLANRPIGTLSGGQLQRVMIARALVISPRILALDEPTVGIDASGQRVFAELLDRVHKALGLTILIISHDMRAIAAGSDTVACLARRLHTHVTPDGLTPQVLAELFSHDLAAIAGPLGPVHIHAHRASECTDPSHTHDTPVKLNIESPRERRDA
jgi:zinc transport system ATP-binding protein